MKGRNWPVSGGGAHESGAVVQGPWGLGTACHGLSTAVAGQGAEIVFVLPRAMTAAATMDVPSSPPSRPTAAGAAAARVAYRAVPSRLRSPHPGSGFSDSPTAWVSTEEWEDWPAPEGGLRVVGAGSIGGYGGELLGRTEAYARRCVGVASAEQFDIVHAHDWMTFRAGQAIAARFGKPLVVHVHATEFDRSGEHVHQPVYDLERAGVHAADRVLAVSGLTRDVLLSRYGVPAEKIQVVHNGMVSAEEPGPMAALRERRRTVLFSGGSPGRRGPAFSWPPRSGCSSTWTTPGSS